LLGLIAAAQGARLNDGGLWPWHGAWRRFNCRFLDARPVAA
jgi:hypothetical protein